MILSSPSYCTQRIDIERAVQAASGSGVLVYTGFDSSTHSASPQGGYEQNPVTVLRASAMNGYRQGAAGVHLFNYDYRSHRQRPVPEGAEVAAKPVGTDKPGHFTASDLQDLKDLGDPKALERLDRCYYAESRAMNFPGDHPPQVPQQLSLAGRGAGAAHAIRIRVDDDIAAGRADGRIRKTELRLRLTHVEDSLRRVRCEVNGEGVDLVHRRQDPEPEGRRVAGGGEPAGPEWESIPSSWSWKGRRPLRSTRIVVRPGPPSRAARSSSRRDRDGLGACAAEINLLRKRGIGPYFPDFSAEQLCTSKSRKSVLDSPLSRYDHFCGADS